MKKRDKQCMRGSYASKKTSVKTCPVLKVTSFIARWRSTLLRSILIPPRRPVPSCILLGTMRTALIYRLTLLGICASSSLPESLISLCFIPLSAPPSSNFSMPPPIVSLTMNPSKVSPLANDTRQNSPAALRPHLRLTGLIKVLKLDIHTAGYKYLYRLSAQSC